MVSMFDYWFDCQLQADVGLVVQNRIMVTQDLHQFFILFYSQMV